MKRALEPHRPLHVIVPPGTMDGGDVLVVGRRVYVGLSTRTNAAGVAQLHQALAPYGYTVCAITVRGCLHLKSAVTAVGDDLLLVNPEWIDKNTLEGFRFVEIDPAEPMAANALRVGGEVIYPAAFPRTAERLARCGVRVRSVEASEVAKAEGAVTCCSVIFKSDARRPGPSTSLRAPRA
jgi:dimethylargininase